jgi:hypothetical protein
MTSLSPPTSGVMKILSVGIKAKNGIAPATISHGTAMKPTARAVNTISPTNASSFVVKPCRASIRAK